MGRSGQMIVDEGLELVTGTSPNSFTLLNTNSGYLFVGGVPPTYQAQVLTTLQQVGGYSIAGVLEQHTKILLLSIQVPAPLLACFPSLSINGVFEDLRIPQASSGIEQCLAVYNNLVTLQRDAYLLVCKYHIGR